MYYYTHRRKTMITIREAKVSDLTRILELYSLLFGKGMLNKTPDVVKIWDRLMDDPFYHVIVAEEDGKLVSTCSVMIIENITYDHRPYAVVDNIVTDSEYRAQGLASACLEEAKKIAEKADCIKIMLTTTSKLNSTYRFYERLGYSRQDTIAFTQWI